MTLRRLLVAVTLGVTAAAATVAMLHDGHTQQLAARSGYIVASS